MKIEHFKNGSITTYNDNETYFIATLNEVAQRNIHRGLATPYDYGYDPQRVYFTIDGYAIAGVPTERKHFIELFKELKEVDMSDNNKYWILEHEGFYWCISTSEIEFIRVGGEWHYLKDEGADAIDKIVGGVTLDEDEDVEWEEELVPCDEKEEHKLSYEEQYDLRLEIYEDFEKKFSHYLLHDNRADETTFKLWKAFENHISSAQTKSIKMDNKFCIITWLEHNWGAFLGCIIDGSFKYMNVSSIVLDSWNKFCE